MLSLAVLAGHLWKGLDYTEVENGIRNSLHIAVFAAFAGTLFCALRYLGDTASVLATLIIVVVVGVASEALQQNIGVEPNYSPESPRDDQLTARAASTGTVVRKRK